MLKMVFAIVAAALIAGAVVIVPTLSSGPAGASEPGRKGDRLDRIAAPDDACVPRGWPYYGHPCNPRQTGRPVRLVSTDRL